MICLEGGGFDLLGDNREGGQDVGVFLFGDAVKMGDEAVEFRAQMGAFGGIGRAVLVALQSDLLCQIIELRRCADQPRRPTHNRPERRIGFSQAAYRDLVYIEYIYVCSNRISY